MVEYPEKSVRHRWTRERFRRSISDITFALAFHSRYCIIEQHLLSSSVIRRDRMYRSRIRVLYEKRATWNETPLGTIYYSRNFFNGTNQIHLGQSRIRRFTVRLKFSGTHSWRQNVYIYIQLFILRMDLFGVWKWCVEERWLKWFLREVNFKNFSMWILNESMRISVRLYNNFTMITGLFSTTINHFLNSLFF